MFLCCSLFSDTFPFPRSGRRMFSTTRVSKRFANADDTFDCAAAPDFGAYRTAAAEFRQDSSQGTTSSRSFEKAAFFLKHSDHRPRFSLLRIWHEHNCFESVFGLLFSANAAWRLARLLDIQGRSIRCRAFLTAACFNAEALANCLNVVPAPKPESHIRHHRITARHHVVFRANNISTTPQKKTAPLARCPCVPLCAGVSVCSGSTATVSPQLCVRGPFWRPADLAGAVSVL